MNKHIAEQFEFDLQDDRREPQTQTIDSAESLYTILQACSKDGKVDQAHE